MRHKKPDPLVPNKKPEVCPVCGNVSYSRAGIHPQCSVKQADEERAANQKKVASTVKPERKKMVSRWQKPCPKCSAQIHVRKKVCDCGHEFEKK